MKHLLNDLSSEEKNRIREQHEGGMTIDTSKFKKLLETKLGDAKPLVMEESTDCSKLIKIKKEGIKGKTAEGTPKSDTWEEDIKKIGNATTTYMFEGPMIKAINTQRKCDRAKTSVTYSEFVRDNGTSYTFIGID
jgi:hypothetical protein